MMVVSINKFKLFKEKKTQISVYRNRIEKMPKPDLLEELLRYHEDFMKNPQDMDATLRGQELMEVLEQRAELKELKALSVSFRKKLADRLKAQLAP